LFYDWRFTVNHFILATSLLRLTTSIFFCLQMHTCSRSPYVTSSLTRGWVCRLELLLAPASAIILSCETHDHILLSQIRDLTNLEGQVPDFISPPPPGTEFPSRRLLRLVGLRRRYSNPPPHGRTAFRMNSVFSIYACHMPCIPQRTGDVWI
jgi:hypothetical protein